jgi:hypothetical protein
MKIIFIVILISTSLNLWATPKKVEVWFLSIDKTAFLNKIIPQTKFSSMTARQLQCQQMGDYCFDPQVGLYKKDTKTDSVISEPLDYSELDKAESYDFAKGHSGGQFETCDNNGHFDIFCGKTKSKKISGNPKLHIWVDISSTMKQVDFESFDQPCRRENFLRTINNSCPLNEKMKVYIFDENRKELGNFDRVCMNAGLNKIERIIRDIKTSTVDHLVIVTDIFEASAKFVDFIEALPGGTTKGIVKPYYAKNLKEEVGRLQSSCK